MNTNRLFVSLILCVFFSGVLPAQISITMSDVQAVYAVGKTAKVSFRQDATSFQMNVGNASSTVAQTWNAMAFTYTDSTMAVNMTAASTPYITSFPMATHAQVQTTLQGGIPLKTYMYYRLMNDSIFFFGAAANLKLFPFIDTTMYMKYAFLLGKTPLTLGSTLLTKDSSIKSVGIYTVTTNRETFDAYGTITLPNGTFPCIRAKIISFVESVNGPAKVNDTLYGYYWLTKEGHELIVRNQLKTAGTGTIGVILPTCRVYVPTTGIAQTLPAVPASLMLAQNYPNPFNPSTSIEFTLAQTGNVSLKIYNTIGQEVATLVNQELPAGVVHKAEFNASALPSGIYFYRLQSAAQSIVKKLTLMK